MQRCWNGDFVSCLGVLIFFSWFPDFLKIYYLILSWFLISRFLISRFPISRFDFLMWKTYIYSRSRKSMHDLVWEKRKWGKENPGNEEKEMFEIRKLEVWKSENATWRFESGSLGLRPVVDFCPAYSSFFLLHGCLLPCWNAICITSPTSKDVQTHHKQTKQSFHCLSPFLVLDLLDEGSTVPIFRAANLRASWWALCAKDLLTASTRW